MSGRLAWIALAVLLVTSAVVFGFGPFEQLLATSPDGTALDTDPRDPAAVAQWLADLGADGRALYGRHLWWDTAFLLLHGGCAFVLLRVPLQRVAARLTFISWLPVAASALDAIENVLAARLLSSWPGTAAGAELLAAVTTVKLLLVPIGFSAMVIAWLSLSIRHLRAGRSQQHRLHAATGA